MKDLRLECVSDQEVKLGDTNTQFLFKAYVDLNRTHFTNHQAVVFHLGDEGKHSIDATITPDGGSVGFSSSALKGLQPGTYQVEMWVTDGAKTDVYPTIGSLSLTINQNLVGEETATVISSIKVADFERRFVEFKQQLIQDVAKLKGPDGKSAYDIWLAHGHTGTVDAFLQDLKGGKGDPGATPVIGEDGNWHIAGVNTELQAIGKNGVGTWDEIKRYIDGKTQQFVTKSQYDLENKTLKSTVTTQLLNAEDGLERYVSSQMNLLDSTKQQLGVALNQANEANSAAKKLLAGRRMSDETQGHFTAHYGGTVTDKCVSIPIAENARLIIMNVDATGFTYNSSNGWKVNVATLTEGLRPTFNTAWGIYRPWHDGEFYCSLGSDGQMWIGTNTDFDTDSGCHVTFMYVRKEG